MKRWFCFLLFLAFAFRPATGAGLIVVDEAHWWPPGQRPPIVPPPWPPPRPWPHPQPRPFAPLEMTRHQADVRVDDQVAVINVDQEFYNPNDRRLEGTFLLPVPRGAQLRKFTLEINGQPTEAELLGADKARSIYEDIVRKLKDPALLEYAGQDVYKVRIFPIEPHERKRVTLSYQQLLPEDNGLVHFLYPLTTEKYSAKPVPSFSLKLQITSQRPLKAIYSPSHTVEIRRDGPRRATVGYEHGDNAPATDFQLYFGRETDEVGVSLLTHRESGQDGHFLLLLSPGLESDTARVLPKDIAFVLDTSGSMAGRKLDQAKKALAFCVENLNDTDRFEIIRFATDTEPLFDRLADATRENRRQAQSFIDRLKPIGGTAIDEALRRALALRSNRSERPFVVIFLTDGLPTVGTTSEPEILKNLPKSGDDTVRVFCFGIGHDVNTHLLDKITEQTRASSTYVLPEEDLEVKVSNFYSRIRDPVLVNPTLRFTGSIRVSQLYPSPLPDLFRGDQLVLVGRYHGDGPSAVVLEGTTAGKSRRFAYDLRFPERDEHHDFVPRLWATRRVGYLLDQIRLHGDNSELRDEVIDLARRYAIVTPYTAYLIVEDETRRRVPVTSQTLPELQRDSASRDALGDTYQRAMRERYGIAPVSRARSEQALKQAMTPQDAVDFSAAEANRGIAAFVPAPNTVNGRPQAPASSVAASSGQTSRFIGGQTFYFNDDQWIDARIQTLRSPRRVQITLGSLEYFDLLHREPQIAEWLALGPKLQFLLSDTVYEITP